MLVLVVVTIWHNSNMPKDAPITKLDRIAQRIAAIAAAKPVNSQAPSAKSAARRKEERRPVYRQGRIIIDRRARIECIIVDASPHGARVEFDGAFSLPEFVLLKVVITGETRRARVVWKRENAAGLSFLMERKFPFGNASKAV